MSKKWSQIPLELPVEPEVKPTVWVLVIISADGWDCFTEVFASKPTVHQLIDEGVREDSVQPLLREGDSWNNAMRWSLKEVTPK